MLWDKRWLINYTRIFFFFFFYGPNEDGERRNSWEELASVYS
jgi:hypothetical protein